MLLSPYPHPIVDTSPDDDDRLLSMRQNFFSIYGLFDQDLELSPGQERDGLHTLYSSHMAFNEVR